ncbi:unnamed protein product [marine sediment metagenome]|uniref:Nucleotide-diphospho-sugar transferase domain-containing protein n=1 Tax=marine sediment metagenome TaxID=412755 RepID=X0SYM5_9ZZZZ
MTVPSSGILIIAYGDDHYFQEANTLIARIRQVWPEVSIKLITEGAGKPKMLGRLHGIRATPFDRTLFLDTDCWLVDPVPELFEILSNFNLALPLSPWRRVYPLDVPACFYDVCPATLAYRKDSEFQEFLDDWERRFMRDYEMMSGVSNPHVGFFHSQPSFTEALYHSDLRFAILGQEYGWQGTGHVQQKVKIVHKRPSPEEAARIINVAAGLPRTKLLFEGVRVWD